MSTRGRLEQEDPAAYNFANVGSNDTAAVLIFGTFLARNFGVFKAGRETSTVDILHNESPSGFSARSLDLYARNKHSVEIRKFDFVTYDMLPEEIWNNGPLEIAESVIPSAFVSSEPVRGVQPLPSHAIPTPVFGVR